MTDEITKLVNRLIESEDIAEVRRLRERLNAVIRGRLEQLRRQAAGQLRVYREPRTSLKKKTLRS